jgi:hypothetical protein
LTSGVVGFFVLFSEPLREVVQPVLGPALQAGDLVGIKSVGFEFRIADPLQALQPVVEFSQVELVRASGWTPSGR